jgi:hypothetical protein
MMSVEGSHPSKESFFLRNCLRLSFFEFISISFLGLKSFIYDAPRFVKKINAYASLIGHNYRFSKNDIYIIGSVHAIASVLTKSTPFPNNSIQISSIDNACAVYSAITMVDAWIDSGNKPLEYKKKYIQLVHDFLIFDSIESDSDVILLDSHRILLLYAREKLYGRQGWPVFSKDFSRLVSAGNKEFSSDKPQTCLRATLLIGAYSAAAIYNSIFIDLPPAKNRMIKIDIMLLGSIMNIIDDIFDYSDDIKSNRKTFVTESPTIYGGQDLGYHTCILLWNQLAKLKFQKHKLAMQNTMAIWWLRNRFNCGDFKFSELLQITRSEK